MYTRVHEVAEFDLNGLEDSLHRRNPVTDQTRADKQDTKANNIIVTDG